MGSTSSLPHGRALSIEKVLCRKLFLHLCADLSATRAVDTAPFSDEAKTEGPLRFVIPEQYIECEEGLKALQKLNLDDFIFQSFNPRALDLTDVLRRASRGIRWRFTRYPEYSVFETTTPLMRNPSELELGILALLQLPIDEYILPAIPGVARVSLRALAHGNIGYLMESVLPKPTSGQFRVAE